MNSQKNQQHLLWRAGFGPSFQDLHYPGNKSPQDIYKDLFQKSQGELQQLIVVTATSLGIEKGEMMRSGINTLTNEQKAKLRKLNREGFKKLNLLWLDEMTNSPAQLREKVALFWHGHFACRVNNILHQQELLHIIRTHALGDFKTLLIEVSKSAAMLSFLNNQQNRKKKPNENFARELMELFTLGHGNYTEQDVKESARAFTGWGFKPGGEFVFRAALHDGDQKTFLGESGNFSGEDIIAIILKQKQTARFITEKAIGFFAGSIPSEKIVQKISDDFYSSSYSIPVLLASIFTSTWFYEEKISGNKIKSPVEWIIGIRRTINLDESQKDWQLIMQKLLGQVIFFPPNVAGWPGGTNWIDSSTLMYRLRFPILLNGNTVDLGNPKNDDDLEMGRPANVEKIKSGSNGISNKLSLHADWVAYTKHFEMISRDKLMNAVRSSILIKDHLDQAVLEKHVNRSSREEYIRSLTIKLMSTPDYQLC
ncbi:DUF1800 domain-containing protein [Pollutibacter soli]|uniref:DUF1800 domain-containing protein n=1 Tax=Pollutibacter soli TaxID=3034157 RepID=UPI003013CDE5